MHIFKTNDVIIISGLASIIICLGLITFPSINQSLFSSINSLGISSTKTWESITYMGDGRFIACFLIIYFWNQPHELLVSIICAITVHLSAQYLKRVFEVLRPEHTDLATTSNFIGPQLNSNDFALPSGHSTATAMCVFLLIGAISNSIFRWTLLALGFIVALSRVVVGAHWPADVFAGISLGCLIVFIFSLLPVVKNRWVATFVYIICIYLSLQVLVEANDYTQNIFLTVIDKVLGAVAVGLCIAGLLHQYDVKLRYLATRSFNK